MFLLALGENKGGLMSNSEWAAWVQAVGSILAVAGAAFAAIWQSRKQHESAMRIRRDDRRHERVELTKTLLELSQNCGKLFAHFIKTLNNDRETVHKIAEGDRHLDFGELVRVE